MRTDILLPKDGSKTYKWHIANYTNDITQYKQVIQFQKAFDIWGTVLNPYKFESTSNYHEADFVLMFIDEAHPIWKHKDIKRVNAYAYYPHTSRRGQVFLNDYRKWEEMGRSRMELLDTIVHEVGHALGYYGHAEERKCPLYKSNVSERQAIPCEDTKFIMRKKFGLIGLPERQDLIDMIRNTHSKRDLWLLSRKGKEAIANLLSRDYDRVKPRFGDLLRVIYPKHGQE